MLLQYDTFSGLVLPSKRAFDNMNREFLEKRKVSLNTYLQVGCQQTVLYVQSVLISFAVVVEKLYLHFSLMMDIILAVDHVYFYE